MGQISPKLRAVTDGGLFFYCPGCKNLHQVKVGQGAGPRWGYNDNATAPTFTPSVLVTMPGRAYRCHSYVTDGRIQFLSDCSHAMAGQTVDLPDLPDDYSDANFSWGD